MSNEEIQEESFPSDEEFDDEEVSDSDSDVDARLAEDDVFDIEFFKCYSALKKKDDKIYDKNIKFFSNELSDNEGDKGDKAEEVQGAESTQASKKTAAPRMTLLDHQLKFDAEEYEDLEKPKIDLNKEVSKSYYEKELDEIKKSIEKVSENIDSDSDDDLLTVKGTKSGPTSSKPRKTIDAILDKLENDDDEDLGHLKQLWSDPDKLTQDEKYLRDYILNKRYLPKEGNNEREGFFSKNLDELSDVDEDEVENEQKEKRKQVDHRSEEKDFDKITRIPRNSTKTIRDLVEKREKKEKRAKRLEKEKKRKKGVKDADFEDVVGDIQTRFHYRETEPNDYGLSAEELLMATDEELEKWVSLKDAIGYKSREEELALKNKFDQRREDIKLKKQIFKSIYGDPNQEADVETPDEVKPKRSKRKRNPDSEATCSETAKVESSTIEASETHDTDQKQGNNAAKRKKKHKRGTNHKKFAQVGVAPDRLLAYGLSKTKLKKSKLL